MIKTTNNLGAKRENRDYVMLEPRHDRAGSKNDLRTHEGKRKTMKPKRSGPKSSESQKMTPQPPPSKLNRRKTSER